MSNTTALIVLLLSTCTIGCQNLSQMFLRSAQCEHNLQESLDAVSDPIYTQDAGFAAEEFAALTDRSQQLAYENQQLEAESMELRRRIHELEAERHANHASMIQAHNEVTTAREELIETADSMKVWRERLTQFRSDLQSEEEAYERELEKLSQKIDSVTIPEPRSESEILVPPPMRTREVGPVVPQMPQQTPHMPNRRASVPLHDASFDGWQTSTEDPRK